MSEWRYIAQRVLTGEWLHWELPLTRDELRWDLSGPGALRGSVAPEVGQLVGSDGLPILHEWGTAIYAETNGQLRWGGLLHNSTFTGSVWQVECAGFTSYPQGIPWTADVYSKLTYDPTTIFGDIWAHVQAQPDGNLGVQTVLPTDCPVRLGTPGVAAYVEVFVDGKWQRKTDVPASKIIPNASGALSQPMTSSDTHLTLSKIGSFGSIPTPFNVTVGIEKITVGGISGLQLTGLTRGVGSTSPIAHAKGVHVSFTDGTQSRTVAAVDPQPYVLSWWEAPDCGQEMDNLAKETPFDYAESHAWGTGSTVAHKVTVGYPRLGRRRSDLAFIEGDNVTSVVEVVQSGDGYANAVVALGKGEGAKTLRAEVAVRDSRLRRPYVYSDKSVGTNARLSSLARKELATRTIAPAISTITVRDHPNARIGSWAVGDDVLIQATLPWLGRVSVWSRITSWTLDSDSTATLTVARSDSFYYGRPATT